MNTFLLFIASWVSVKKDILTRGEGYNFFLEKPNAFSLRLDITSYTNREELSSLLEINISLFNKNKRLPRTLHYHIMVHAILLHGVNRAIWFNTVSDGDQSCGTIDQVHVCWQKGFSLTLSLGMIESHRLWCWFEHDLVGESQVSNHGVVE